MGWPCKSCTVATPSKACSTPLSRRYTLGDFTRRLPTFARNGCNLRTNIVSTSTSRYRVAVVFDAPPIECPTARH